MAETLDRLERRPDVLGAIRCYVALAEPLDAELVTTDARLARAAEGLVGVTATS